MKNVKRQQGASRRTVGSVIRRSRSEGSGHHGREPSQWWRKTTCHHQVTACADKNQRRGALRIAFIKQSKHFRRAAARGASVCHRRSLLTASYLHGLCVCVCLCVCACVVAGKKKDVRWHIASKFGVFHIITPSCHANPRLDSPKMKLWLVSTHTHQTLFKKFSAISVVGCGETEIFLLPKLVLYQLTVCVRISVWVYLSIRSADFSYRNPLCVCVFHVFRPQTHSTLFLFNSGWHPSLCSLLTLFIPHLFFRSETKWALWIAAFFFFFCLLQTVRVCGLSLAAVRDQTQFENKACRQARALLLIWWSMSDP